ncbi:MAG: Dna2/Cas4 domain-containing protein, partial [Methanosphaera sp.]|nr:Dna2/Cas4 domain-containing protein [Methanosphaera sp.]
MKQLESKPEKIECRKHPTISQVQIIDNKPNFPISWMNIQGYCEYSIYLEHFQHIHVGQTKKMKNGTKVHNKLESDFKEEAQIKPLDEIIDISRTQKVISREFFVVSSEYGIRGFIDEIWLEPDKIVIIDDKPGSKAYYSMIHQVYAYALAYKQYITDDRPIEVALRTSTTGNIFWKEEFTQKAQEEIISIINHMQRLITGEDEFIPTDNPNKCRSCRFN